MNKDNINKLIRWLEEDQGRHFAMSRWNSKAGEGEQRARIKHKECGTTLCLAGSCELLAQLDQGVRPSKLRINTPDWRHSFAYAGANYLDLTDTQRDNLFFLQTGDRMMAIDAFDRLCDLRRTAAAVRVLEILRDTGKVCWALAVKETGGWDPNRYVPYETKEKQTA